MSYPTEAMIAHHAKVWHQPSLFKTLKEIRTYPERRECDRVPPRPK